jgi:hypothetical protein
MNWILILSQSFGQDLQDHVDNYSFPHFPEENEET